MYGPCIFHPHISQVERLLRGPDAIVVIPEPDDDYLSAVFEAVASIAVVDALDAAGRWERISGGKRTLIDGEHPPERFLGDAWTTALAKPMRRHVLWLRDVNAALHTPRGLGHLKAVASQIARKSASLRIVLSGHDAAAPSGVSHLARVEALERPSDERAAEFVRAVLRAAGRDDLEEERVTILLERLRGLEASAIRRLIARATADSRADLLRVVKEERDRMLESGVIEVREVHKDAKLGGLDVLMAHLENVRDLLSDWRAQRNDRLLQLLPKGMLLLGPPGCGKSLAAEVAAKVLCVPLLQLHASRLMDKYLGGSEARLETALATARAAAPCVLWIDELEKAVGGLGSSEGGGTTSRMLGRLLSWMQDNRHGVYVIATANSLEHVPPELLRRGRFDDHFVLDLPNERGRKEILAFELKRHGGLVELDDNLLSNLEGFSGADLAALVRDAARFARLRDHSDALVREHLDAALESFEPQAKQWPEEIERMKRAINTHSFRSASSESGKPAKRSIRQDRDHRALAPALAALLGEEPLFATYPWSPGRVIEIATVDGERIATLGPGDETGAHAGQRYHVRQDAREVVLVREGEHTRNQFPTQLRFTADGHGVIHLRCGDGRSRQVTIGPTVAPRDGPPEAMQQEVKINARLRKMLSANGRPEYPIRDSKIGSARVEMGPAPGWARLFVGTRTTYSAKYRVTQDGASLLFEPKYVERDRQHSDWLKRHHIVVTVDDSGNPICRFTQVRRRRKRQ